MAYSEEEKEIWINLNARYSVSNKGRVRSNQQEYIDKRGRKRLRLGKILSTKGVINGYPAVNISNYKHKKTWKVHQLIARTFIENPNNYPVINHKNGIKTDNRAINLEWCTQKYNCLHAFKTGLRNPVVNAGLKNGYSNIILDQQTGVYYYSINELSALLAIERRKLGRMIKSKKITNLIYV